MEKWKEWPKDGRWEVSDLGRVRLTGTNIIKTPHKKDGYDRMSVTRDHSPQYVHRMMMETFLPIVNSDTMTVNHINMEKSDNRLGNLEWCLNTENVIMADAILKRGASLQPINSPVAAKLRVEWLIQSLDDRMAVAFDLLEKMKE